ncbi:MAG: nuclear transport factor 2 family protein [Gemmatimonadaceae bacterium]
MPDMPIEKQLEEMENKYWQAIKEKDVAAAMRLTDDYCLVAGAQGVAKIDRDSFGKMLGAARWTLHDFKLSEVQVRLVSDDVAILAYKVSETLTVEERGLILQAADASTWVRRDGNWLCALHTEAVAGDPFGRDKNPAK